MREEASIRGEGGTPLRAWELRILISLQIPHSFSQNFAVLYGLQNFDWRCFLVYV